LARTVSSPLRAARRRASSAASCGLRASARAGVACQQAVQARAQRGQIGLQHQQFAGQRGAFDLRTNHVLLCAAATCVAGLGGCLHALGQLQQFAGLPRGGVLLLPARVDGLDPQRQLGPGRLGAQPRLVSTGACRLAA
jgi:hypothetical protein